MLSIAWTWQQSLPCRWWWLGDLVILEVLGMVRLLSVEATRENWTDLMASHWIRLDNDFSLVTPPKPFELSISSLKTWPWQLSELVFNMSLDTWGLLVWHWAIRLCPASKSSLFGTIRWLVDLRPLEITSIFNLPRAMPAATSATSNTSVEALWIYEIFGYADQISSLSKLFCSSPCHVNVYSVYTCLQCMSTSKS